MSNTKLLLVVFLFYLTQAIDLTTFSGNLKVHTSPQCYDINLPTIYQMQAQPDGKSTIITYNKTGLIVNNTEATVTVACNLMTIPPFNIDPDYRFNLNTLQLYNPEDTNIFMSMTCNDSSRNMQTVNTLNSSYWQAPNSDCGQMLFEENQSMDIVIGMKNGTAPPCNCNGVSINGAVSFLNVAKIGTNSYFNLQLYVENITGEYVIPVNGYSGNLTCESQWYPNLPSPFVSIHNCYGKNETDTVLNRTSESVLVFLGDGNTYFGADNSSSNTCWCAINSSSINLFCFIVLALLLMITFQNLI